jgi:hypothetical protein
MRTHIDLAAEKKNICERQLILINRGANLAFNKKKNDTCLN